MKFGGQRATGFLVLLGMVLAVSGCGDDGETLVPYPRDSVLRLNHFQVIGTHNSYHIEPRPSLMERLLRSLPTLAVGLQYSHVQLKEQFDQQGVRQIELDVFADPDGGLFAHRAGLAWVRENPWAEVPELYEPGFKVLHVQDVDFESTCWTLVSCLREVKQWSKAHPLHMPIMILIELKDEPIPFAGSAMPRPIGARELDALDGEIRSVFAAHEMVTPDDVRGPYETLREAVRERGWPSLGETRGKVLFALDNGGSVLQSYLAGRQNLQGRVMFASVGTDHPAAGFLKLNDPIGDFDRIRSVVADGFVVRTRADADTVEARTGNTEPRDRALESGAQWVSTDYPVPDRRWGHGYVARIPGGVPARCNPVSAPSFCQSTDIENPMFLR